MTYHPEFLLRVYAHSTLAVFSTHVFGLLVSLLSLAFQGGLLRRVFVSQHNGLLHSARPEPWATHITLGLVTASAYFVLRSALTKACSWIPPMVEQEQLFVTFGLGLTFWRRELRNMFRDWAQGGSVAVFFVFAGTMLVHGYWFFFRLTPASTDPGVLAVLIDLARHQGQVAHVYSSLNDAVPVYPAGVEILGMAFLNPLLTSASFVHIWPALSTSLMAFMAFELLAADLSGRALLSVFVLMVTVRVGLGTFEVSNVWSHLEGMSKRSLGPFALFAVAVAYQMRAVPRASGAALAVSFFAVALICLVNPVNVAVCFVLGLIIAFLGLPSWRTNPVAPMVGLSLAVLLALLGVLQDPLVMTRLSPSGISCRLFDAPFCHWSPSKVAGLTEQGAGHALIALPLGAWVEHVPEMVARPWSMILPQGSVPLVTEASSFAWWLILLPLGWFVSSRRGLHWRAVLAVSCVFVVTWMAFLVQTYALWRVSDGHIQRLIEGYETLSYLNLWQPAFFVALIGSGVIVVRKWSRFGVAAFFVSVIAVCSWNLREIANRFAKTVGARAGLSTSDEATLLLGVRDALAAYEVVMLSPVHSETDFESWAMLEDGTAALQLYSGHQSIYSYSSVGFWPVGETIAEHFEKLCHYDCAHLESEGGDVMIDWEFMTSICGMPVGEYAARSGCFEQRATVTTRGNRATVYTLRKGHSSETTSRSDR